MKNVTYGEKSVLVGDDAADALLEYARVIADNHRADTVTLQGINSDGDTIEASFLLSSSATLMIESTNSAAQPLDNERVVADIWERIVSITRPAHAEVGEPWATNDPDLSDIL